jgi:hypothetical protein
MSKTGWFLGVATGQSACPLKNLNILPARNPRRATLKSQVPVWLVLVNGGTAKRTTGAKRLRQLRTTLTSTSQTYNRTKASAPELAPCGCTPIVCGVKAGFDAHCCVLGMAFSESRSRHLRPAGSGGTDLFIIQCSLAPNPGLAKYLTVCLYEANTT